MSADRAYRLWRQEGLQVPKRRPRRRVATSRPRPPPPTAVNHVWAYDFVFDACADGRTLKCLTIIDEFTRECTRSDRPDGGPLRYRVVHTASLWKPGERPVLRQHVIEGDPGLSI